MTYEEIIRKVAVDTKIPVEVVNKVYKSFWLFIRNSVNELPLKEELTETEFLNLKTNFNIPSLGKFACTYKRYLGVKNRFNYIKTLKDNEETDKGEAYVQ